MSQLTLRPLAGTPQVQAGDDLAGIVKSSLLATGETLRDRDVLILAQKIVSKAEGRMVDLTTVSPSPRAVELAGIAQKDPRLVELILSESTEVLRCKPGVIIVAHRLGYVLANAGIDQSNVGHASHALLLPVDPDTTSRQLREQLRADTGVEVGVLIIDSIGRAWRNGTIGTAIGLSGIPGLLNRRGYPDLFGRKLETTEIGFADELAAAASLVMGQGDEGTPIVLARGVPYERRDGAAAELVRPKSMDLFR